MGNSSNDKEKGLESFKLLFDEFGENDIYKRILLEEIFRELKGLNSKGGDNGEKEG